MLSKRQDSKTKRVRSHPDDHCPVQRKARAVHVLHSLCGFHPGNPVDRPRKSLPAQSFHHHAQFRSTPVRVVHSACGMPWGKPVDRSRKYAPMREFHHRAQIFDNTSCALRDAFSTADVECPGASLWTDHLSARPRESFTIMGRFSTTPHAHYAVRFPQPMWNALG